MKLRTQNEIKRTGLKALLAGTAAVAFGLALAACSQDKAPTETADAGETPAVVTETETPVASGPASPAIWTLADEDTTIYLFGTVHVLKPDLDWRTDEFNAILESADMIYVEADVTSAEAQAAMGPLVMSLGTYTDGGSLTATLDDAEEKELKEALDILGVPMAAVDTLQPWLAGLQLSNVLMMQQGYSPGSGVEMVILGEAETRGTPIGYFETAEEQIRIFATLPEDDQIAFLVATAEAIENEPDMLDQLVAEWAEADVDTIGEMMADVDSMGSTLVYDRLLVERNANWIPQIEAILEKPGVYLIAVGAGHFAGDDSVIAMLRAKGYEVVGP